MLIMLVFHSFQETTVRLSNQSEIDGPEEDEDPAPVPQDTPSRSSTRRRSLKQKHDQ